MRRTILSFSLLFLAIVTVSCGSHSTVHIKDFRIYVNTDDQEVLATVHQLADQYNADFGETAIEIVASKEESNSEINFISGLRKREEKLGLGQWLTTTTSESVKLSHPQKDLQTVVVHTMKLHFDLENFQRKMIDRDDQNSGNWRHLYHLFCHEIGHGLQFDHEDDTDSVMYPTIPESSRPRVDYSDYFAKARSFFNQ